jgi:chaperonin GroEL (HSP60 family)
MSTGGSERQKGNAKEKDVRMSNIIAAKAVADAVRTSLGPRGMDKMIQKGEVLYVMQLSPRPKIIIHLM